MSTQNFFDRSPLDIKFLRRDLIETSVLRESKFNWYSDRVSNLLLDPFILVANPSFPSE